MSPLQATAIPPLATLSSRWPGMPQEEMESLGRDYRAEGKQLEELDLEGDYHKVRELVLHETSWRSESRM